MGLDIIYIGTSFFYNQPIQEYVQREALKYSPYLKSIQFYKENDRSLFLMIEELFEKEKKALIVTTQTSFITVSKIISTLLEDTLVLKEEKLIPSKSIKSTFKSYLIQEQKSMINVIEVEQNCKIPEIFFQPYQTSVLQIFDESLESLEVLLDPLSQTYEVKIEYTTLIQGWIEVYVYPKKYGNVDAFVESVKKLLPLKTIIAKNIMDHIIKSLAKNGKKISFAESCTGGLLSYFLTKNNGSSSVFDGSLVTYANHIKENWLAVSEENLIKYGAVSSAVVEEMSEGAMGVSEADFAISVSGIAGDGGGSEEKPVGTVFLNVRSNDKNTTLQLQLQGDRNYIQYQSVLFGIKTLLTENKKLFF